MPKNRNALIRYQIIDRCLSDVNKTWTLQQIIDEVSDYFLTELGNERGISKRTVEYDLEFMQSSEGYNAPIEKEKVRKEYYWYYTDRKFSITKSPLDRRDTEKLNEALIILKQFEHFPQFQDIEEIILKLQSKAIGTKKNPRNIIQFETNSLAEGNRHLKNLYNYLSKQLAIELVYQPFGKESFNITVHPYLLKEYNNRWFLFGKDDNKKQIQNYALDRILSLEVSNKEFEVDETFDPDVYFKDVIGVSVPEIKVLKRIVLSFKPEQGYYIKTKPIHFSQKVIKDNKKECRIELFLIPNYELNKTIWSFGENVKLISPKSLVIS